MKRSIQKSANEGGSTLMMVLVVTGIIGFLMVSYLTLLRSQNNSVFRSQVWNSTIPLIEAGLEEAMAHMNQNGLTNILSPQNPIPNLYADGWTNANGVAVMSRSLGDARYVVTIATNITSTNGMSVTLECVGYVPAPTTLASVNNSDTDVMFAAVAVTTPKAEVRRAVRVTATNNAIFTKGIVVRKTINSSGGSSMADAFDSSNPLFSTNGQYVAAKATDGGGIATLSSAANALSFGSLKSYGPVSVGPGGSISGSYNVGTHAWLATHSGIQPGYFAADMAVNFPNVQTPAPGGVSPLLSQTIGGTLYAYVLDSGNYETSIGPVKGKVLVRGNALWYITKAAAVSFASGDSITISSNATLRLYVGCDTATLPNVVNTNNGTADKFTYFGLPTNSNLVQNINADFIGTVYAPYAKYTLGGNGSGAEQKIIGAVVVDSMAYNDFFTYHYDMSLGRLGLSRGFIVNSWNEIDPKLAKVQ
jgi:hypothetical protein